MCSKFHCRLRFPTGPCAGGTRPVSLFVCGYGNRFLCAADLYWEVLSRLSRAARSVPEKVVRQLYSRSFSELRSGSGFFSPIELGAAARRLPGPLDCTVPSTFRCPLPEAMATFAQNARRTLHYTDNPRL